jgi:PKD repeat protein
MEACCLQEVVSEVRVSGTARLTRLWQLLAHMVGMTFLVTIFSACSDGGSAFEGDTSSTPADAAAPGSDAGPPVVVAQIAAEPPHGYVPLTITFDGSGSTAAGDEILTYDWDLDGDGQIDATGISATRTYDDPGSVEVALTVTDDDQNTATVSLEIEAQVHAPQTLFLEQFETNPFPDQRWRVLHGDCVTPKNGTVQYVLGEDGCGGSGGHIVRDNTGGRCVVYDGQPFSTAGYQDVWLRYAYRLDGGSIAVGSHGDGGWSAPIDQVSGSSMPSWQQRELSLTSAVDGLRFSLDGSSARRLDCIAIEGVPLSKPAVARVCPGGTAWFSVTAFAEEALSYQWRHAGTDLTDGGNITGAQGPVLKITQVSEQDIGGFRCVIQTAQGQVWSNVSTLLMQTEPVVQPAANTAERASGSDADLSVTAQGVGELSYQWRHDGVDLIDSGRISGAHSPTLHLSALEDADAGEYSCVVTDDCGSAESSPTLLVVRTWDAEVTLPSEGTVPVDLQYDEDFIIEADLHGCSASGVWQRYLHKTDRIDLMTHHDNRIALRLGNTKIWFASANLGTVSTAVGEPDHFGESIPASVHSGDHVVRIEYLGSVSRCRLYWDGALIGDWNLQIASLPGNIGSLDTMGTIASGALRYYQGSFVSLAD